MQSGDGWFNLIFSVYFWPILIKSISALAFCCPHRSLFSSCFVDQCILNMVHNFLMLGWRMHPPKKQKELKPYPFRFLVYWSSILTLFFLLLISARQMVQFPGQPSSGRRHAGAAEHRQGGWGRLHLHRRQPRGHTQGQGGNTAQRTM